MHFEIKNEIKLILSGLTVHKIRTIRNELLILEAVTHLFLHKSQPVFDEVSFLRHELFVPAINRPEFNDKE